MCYCPEILLDVYSENLHCLSVVCCPVQFSSVQFSSVQFSSVQFSSVQFSSVHFICPVMFITDFHRKSV